MYSFIHTNDLVNKIHFKIMTIKKISLVTFDAINTLLKFRIPPWHFYTLAAKGYGFTGTENDVRLKFMDSYNFMWTKFPNFGKSMIPWKKWWEKVLENTFADTIPKFKDTDMSKILIEEFKSRKLWCVAEGSRPLLNILEKKGMTLGIISNFDPRLHDILRNVDLTKQFKFIITSYEAGFSKPDPKIFMLAMKNCGLTNPAECLHIGDDVNKDYDGAMKAGWHALIVPSPHNPLFIQTDKSPASEHVFQSLQTLAIAIQEGQLKF
ncbi:rhythmically expressed gene 2 protein-like [Plodia interpunctella]|uniref:rhythmically expressed gene 2 protein-like n=1 Tax=Plodia interpunctella TaxID=58824 RepID=UPI002367F666|nr:rhythmically expressed gene 2 protein-like [Plodia interpunctella]